MSVEECAGGIGFKETRGFCRVSSSRIVIGKERMGGKGRAVNLSANKYENDVLAPHKGSITHSHLRSYQRRRKKV